MGVLKPPIRANAARISASWVQAITAVAAVTANIMMKATPPGTRLYT